MATLLKGNLSVSFFNPCIFQGCPDFHLSRWKSTCPDFSSTVSIIVQFKEAIVTFYLRVCLSQESGRNMLSTRIKDRNKGVTWRLPFQTKMMFRNRETGDTHNKKSLFHNCIPKRLHVVRQKLSPTIIYCSWHQTLYQLLFSHYFCSWR